MQKGNSQKLRRNMQTVLSMLIRLPLVLSCLEINRSFPEDLHGGDIDEIMDFTPEYLSRYEEQVKKNQKDLKNKDAVIESLKADAERRLSKKDETIAAQANEIKDSTEENALLRN